MRTARIYIARGDDIVVVDADTNSVIGEVRIATNIPNEGAQSLTITDDGTIYVTLEDTVVAVEVASPPTQHELGSGGAGFGRKNDVDVGCGEFGADGFTIDGDPDQTTGQITGNVNASDLDGNSLTYTVPPSGAGAPTRGTVSVNGTTGAFVYKPTSAARTAAGISAGPDFDTFTVTVSDGQGGATPVTVQVPVLPGVFEKSNTPAVRQTNPSGVAIVGNRAYVANQGTNTVSVIDTTTGAAVGNPIVVGSAPTGVAAKPNTSTVPNSSTVYVTNRTSGTLSVISTADNKVVNTITVGIRPRVGHLQHRRNTGLCRNYGSKSVSVIDTTLAQQPKVIATISNVGTNPRGIAYVQTANGPRGCMWPIQAVGRCR